MKRTLSLTGLILAFFFCVTFASAQQHAGTGPAAAVAPAHVAPSNSLVHVAPAAAAGHPGQVPANAPRTASPHPAGAHVAKGSVPVVSNVRPAKPAPQRKWNGPAGPVAPVAMEENATPGLGFDYVHYFATHPDAGKHQDANTFGNGLFIPLYGGGYMPYPVYVDQPAEQEETADTTAPAEQESAQAQGNAAGDRQPYTSPVRAAASKPVQEYAFVRRDGTIFFAVGYTWANDKLQYVTRDGLRRTLPLESLDLDATQSLNDKRGIEFRAPA